MNRTSAAVFLGVVLVFGCKKASTVDVIDGGEPASAIDSAIAETSSGGDGESAAAEGGGSGGGSESAGGSASGANSGGAAPSDSAGSAAAGDGGAAPSGAASSGAAADGGAGSAAGGTAGGGQETAGGAGGATKDPNPSQPGAPAGIVDFLNINASGGTTDATLKAALDKAKTRYRGCYGKALASDSSTQGTLKLRATIAADGVVDKVEVIGGNLGLSPLVQCSVATTKSLKIAGAAAPATKATFDIKFSK